MLRLTRWMSQYYLCPLGQVLEAVVPSGVRGQAGTREQVYLRVPTAIAARITQLKLPEKQAAALRILAMSPQPLTPAELAEAAHCTQAPILTLRRKKLVVDEVRRIHLGIADAAAVERQKHLLLNDDQQLALQAILGPLRENRHETIVVHGVTGSGKTEVYIRAIDEVIQYGRQAIVLVPEISLTPQTRTRFQSRFDRVAVLHSHLTPPERHWHWRQIASGQVQVIVARKAPCLPPLRISG